MTLAHEPRQARKGATVEVSNGCLGHLAITMGFSLLTDGRAHLVTYQPLARKYRPHCFAELVGQESVAKALANAIAMKREPHGVIFTGVRGVGKTTVARLYAKALNCSNRLQTEAGIEPCNTCESCLAIARGNHEDVLEIDGASNTGVADVRALQETVSYQPQRSQFKIYIIDEVHMLSQAAFNALLKTLEEPPSHVVFIFATTEMHKVPQTIVSRCQAFYLPKLSTPLIAARLRQILGREEIEAEDKAVAVIAREGHGSMRDALTLLDQAIALGGGKVTLASLSGLVVNLSSSPYLELLAALTKRDAANALAVVEKLDQSGVEFATVVEETAQLARHAFVQQGLGSNALDRGQLGLDDAELAALSAIVSAAAPFDLNRIFRTLVKCRGELEGSGLDRYIFENYLCEWCFDPGLPELSELIGRGRSSSGSSFASSAPLSQPLSTGSTGSTGSTASASVSRLNTASVSSAAAGAAAAATVPPTKQAQPVASLPRQLPASWRQLVDAWKQQKPLQARKLEEVHPIEYGPDRIVVAIGEESYASRTLLQRDEQQKIKEQFRELFGFAGILVVQSKAQAPVVPEALPETILTERDREAEGRRERLIDEARNAPFTRDLLSVLGGRLEDVRIPESEQPKTQ